MMLKIIKSDDLRDFLNHYGKLQEVEQAMILEKVYTYEQPAQQYAYWGNLREVGLTKKDYLKWKTKEYRDLSIFSQELVDFMNKHDVFDFCMDNFGVIREKYKSVREIFHSIDILGCSKTGKIIKLWDDRNKPEKEPNPTEEIKENELKLYTDLVNKFEYSWNSQTYFIGEG